MKRKFGYILLTFVLTAFLCAVIISLSLYFYLSHELNSEIDIAALTDAGGLTTLIYAPDGKSELCRLHSEQNRISVTSEEISDNIKNAFIAIEDHRFYSHSGIDIKRTAGAALSFLGGKQSYGGSTITQQLIKNLTGENQPSIKRKLKEIVRAVYAEKTMHKDNILTSYLNTVYLAEGCYGVETASQLYFSKSADNITLSEAATLAAIVKYPYYYDPIKYPDHNKNRRDTVLYRMFTLGIINADEYDDAVNEDISLRVSKSVGTSEIPSWFCETVIDEVCADLETEYGYSHEYATKLISGGGLKIITTCDTELQTALEKYYGNKANFPTSGVLEAPESAAVIFDAHSGALLATVGSNKEKTSGRILNPAFSLLRSPGSSLKPLSVYASAIDAKAVTWSTVIDDVPKIITKADDGSYNPWPKNNPRIYSGLTNTAHGIEQSKNTVSVDILSRIGTEKSFDTLKKLGISTLAESKTSNGKVYTDKDYAPLALGALTNGCSLYELTGAYTMLSDGGVFHEPHSYSAVYDKSGNLLLGKSQSERIISDDAADIMTRMLENVVLSGTAKGMKISNKIAIAGKTGTSNANTDRWFIGYTPDYICGIWYGYRDGRDIGNYTQNPACTVFDGVMNAVYNIYPEKLKNEFTHSENVVKCRYCKDSGMIESSACSLDPRGERTEVGYFIKGTEPTAECDKHITVKYNTVSGGIACESCPENELCEIALIKNYDRSFPCQITVSDAQYMYRFVPFGTEYCTDTTRAFFENTLSYGEYCGTSGGTAYNRYCTAEHKPEPIIPPVEYEDDDLLSYLRRLFSIK